MTGLTFPEDAAPGPRRQAHPAVRHGRLAARSARTG